MFLLDPTANDYAQLPSCADPTEGKRLIPETFVSLGTGDLILIAIKKCFLPTFQKGRVYSRLVWKGETVIFRASIPRITFAYTDLLIYRGHYLKLEVIP